MRGHPPPVPARRRSGPHGSPARHRPRPPAWSRLPPDPGRMRLSDIVLALVGLGLLGGLALTAAYALTGGASAP